jgi:molecular chaperone DnaK
VDEATREAIATAITELKSAAEGEDTEEIQTKSQALAEASMKLGEAIYQAQAAEEAENAENADPADEASGQEDDDIVDAEFEEVNDDKKS